MKTVRGWVLLRTVRARGARLLGWTAMLPVVLGCTEAASQRGASPNAWAVCYNCLGLL